MDKPIVILTTFFEANSKIGNGFISAQVEGKLIRHEIVQYGCPKWNTAAISIALSNPKPCKLKNITCMDTEVIFCPTYEMLVDYKKGGDWEKYTNKYMNLLKIRKDAIHDWIANLEPKLYFLCCWENTAGGAHCHRRILYDAFTKSKFAKEKMLAIYSHGNSKNDFEPNRSFDLTGVEATIAEDGPDLPAVRIIPNRFTNL